ncbi:hypothetical protein [Anaeromassilibacillus sp. An200]|uniref:hypothetical protein n=1 Tax=Anaeromassilibacillus sp. An200 TaxID=1965587 RepID=UPI000B39D5C7|nr:hypothetical protein [Anaeromassilibacillus sp. An200]OUP09903.1 hypothetical protein B5F35_12070 [Anaeromassilibacillus sp. An200]
MEYMIIGVCIIAIVVIDAVVIFKSKTKATNSLSPSEVSTDTSSRATSMVQDTASQEFRIQVEMLPTETIGDESKLIEITDSRVLARVNSLVPGLVQAGNAINNAVQAAQTQGEVLYRAIIPAGAKLADSRAMDGAVRGFYHGAEGIQGHANWVAVEAQKGTAVIANTAAATMGVASIVVGQYYMTQINAELGQISDGISKIADFQDNEYRSRVFSLVSHIKKIAEFQVEILENDELRLSKIAQLDSLEEECTKLLGQANLTLAGVTKKNDLDFATYEKELQEAQNWYIYQNTLLEMLHKISDLRFALHLGAVSRAQCTALLPTYTQQVEETQSRLTQWHQDTTKRLNVDTAEIRRKRKGWDKAIHFIPGLINDDWNFCSISEKTAYMIDSQASGRAELHHDNSDFYLEDVQLISKGDKVYYLPPCKN